MGDCFIYGECYIYKARPVTGSSGWSWPEGPLKLPADVPEADTATSLQCAGSGIFQGSASSPQEITDHEQEAILTSDHRRATEPLLRETRWG